MHIYVDISLVSAISLAIFRSCQLINEIVNNFVSKRSDFFLLFCLLLDGL